jgi:ketosteroid isomerase-like protein
MQESVINLSEEKSMSPSRFGRTVAAVGFLAIATNVSAWALSGDEAAVDLAVDTFGRALLSGNSSQLEALFAPELIYGHSDGQVQTGKELIDTRASGTLVPKSIDLSDRHITVVGDDAIVRYNFTAEAVNRAGQNIPIRIGVMEVWQKRVGNWVMFAHQAYPRATPK